MFLWVCVRVWNWVKTSADNQPEIQIILQATLLDPYIVLPQAWASIRVCYIVACRVFQNPCNRRSPWEHQWKPAMKGLPTTVCNVWYIKCRPGFTQLAQHWAVSLGSKILCSIRLGKYVTQIVQMTFYDARALTEYTHRTHICTIFTTILIQLPFWTLNYSDCGTLQSFTLHLDNKKEAYISQLNDYLTVLAAQYDI